MTSIILNNVSLVVLIAHGEQWLSWTKFMVDEQGISREHRESILKVPYCLSMLAQGIEAF